MAAKMKFALDAMNRRISLSMAEEKQYKAPLTCEFCEALVSFVNGYPRTLGDDIIFVESYFRLKNRDSNHGTDCRYNVEKQIKTIVSRESDGNVLSSLKDGVYELRLLAVKQALTQIKSLPENDEPKGENSKPTEEKKYVSAKQKLSSYINTAKQVLQVRAYCEDNSDLEKILKLKFDDLKLPWKDFYYDIEEYFRCFTYVSKLTVTIPIAISGIVKTNKIVKGRKGNLRVINLKVAYRKTEEDGVVDAAGFSIWSSDTTMLSSFEEGQNILAFGLWDVRGIKESESKKSGQDSVTFRNHEMRLWPVSKNQVCLIE